MANEPFRNAPLWNHPAPEELLLAHEGQLEAGQAAAISAHLQQCWECRARVEQFTRGVDAYVRYRKLAFDRAASPRTGAWVRFSARLREMEPVQRSGWRRLLWLAAPAAVAAVWLGVTLVTPTPLTAKVVLDRALRADSARSARVGHVQVRRGGKLLLADDVVLGAARIDRAKPLSVAPYRAWHDSLAAHQDSVAVAAGEIRLETTTAEGLIALASLTVGSSDYVAHAKHVELRDGVTIDVDAAEAIPETTSAAPDGGSAAPAPAPKAAANTGERETLEMEVRWALRRIDADLGEPLQIQAAGDDLVVSGTIDDAARRDQIGEALKGLPRVSTQLGVAEPDANLLDRAQAIEPGTQSGTGADPLMSPQLMKDFPEPEARRRFVSRAVHVSQTVLRHAWALRRLAERYPASVAGTLPEEARKSLDRLVEAHRDAGRAAMAEAAALWKPYVQLSVGPASRLPWQTISVVALQNAQAFDHFTARLLAAGGKDGLAVSDALEGLAASYGRIE